MNEYVNSILNVATCGNWVEIMKQIPENTINLIVTSPPYNVGIKYDEYKDDELTMEEYFDWCLSWLKSCYRILDSDGRIALNVPYEIGLKSRGGRYFMSAEFYRLALQAGFKFFGLVDLEEQTPHRVKFTSWGSWMSSSSPYIYNPKECVILFYKETHIRNKPGISWMPIGEEKIVNTENPDKIRIKQIYSE
jgi:site-specific DNA-methyltransferase (adenine-specific)